MTVNIEINIVDADRTRLAGVEASFYATGQGAPLQTETSNEYGTVVLTAPIGTEGKIFIHDTLDRFPDQWFYQRSDREHATFFNFVGEDGYTAHYEIWAAPADRLDLINPFLRVTNEMPTGTVCEVFSGDTLVATSTLAAPSPYWAAWDFEVIGQVQGTGIGQVQYPGIPLGTYTMRVTEVGGRVTEFTVSHPELSTSNVEPGEMLTGYTIYPLDGYTDETRPDFTALVFEGVPVFPPRVVNVGQTQLTTIDGTGAYQLSFTDELGIGAWRFLEFTATESGHFLMHTRQQDDALLSELDTLIFQVPSVVEPTWEMGLPYFDDAPPQIDGVNQPPDWPYDGYWSHVSLDVVAGEHYIFAVGTYSPGVPVDFTAYVIKFPGEGGAGGGGALHVPHKKKPQKIGLYDSKGRVTYRLESGDLPPGLIMLSGGSFYGVAEQPGSYTAQVTLYDRRVEPTAVQIVELNYEVT